MAHNQYIGYRMTISYHTYRIQVDTPNMHQDAMNRMSLGYRMTIFWQSVCRSIPNV